MTLTARKAIPNPPRTLRSVTTNAMTEVTAILLIESAIKAVAVAVTADVMTVTIASLASGATTKLEARTSVMRSAVASPARTAARSSTQRIGARTGVGTLGASNRRRKGD